MSPTMDPQSRQEGARQVGARHESSGVALHKSSKSLAQGRHQHAADVHSSNRSDDPLDAGSDGGEANRIRGIGTRDDGIETSPDIGQSNVPMIDPEVDSPNDSVVEEAPVGFALQCDLFKDDHDQEHQYIVAVLIE